MPIRTVLRTTPTPGAATVTIAATASEPWIPVTGVTLTAELGAGLQAIGSAPHGHITQGRGTVVWSDQTVPAEGGAPLLLQAIVTCVEGGSDRTVLGGIIKTGYEIDPGTVDVECGEPIEQPQAQ